MLDYIRKKDYFRWVEQLESYRGSYTSSVPYNLKDIQDHYVLDRLRGLKGVEVLEIGGADCRVLRNFVSALHCWNAEKFEGLGNGPKKQIATDGVSTISAYLGEFSPELQNGFYDFVFSISVVEHVVDADLANFFRDIARVLKPGGTTFHAIDLYVFDPDQSEEQFYKYSKRRLALYRDIPALSGGTLEFVNEPVVPPEPLFRCSMASNADREMLKWNKFAPALTEMRSEAQSVSLICELRRNGTQVPSQDQG